VVIGAIMLAFSALALAVVVTVIVSRGAPVVWLVIGLSAAAAYISLACRLLMVGTYVGAEGLRIRKPLRTLTFGWSEVLSVRSRKVTRTVSSPPQTVTARQVCFDLTDGQTVESPLYGAMRGAGRPWRMPDILPAAEFDRVVAELRHLTAVHQTRNREQAPS
jgi:hypothetical protein